MKARALRIPAASAAALLTACFFSRAPETKYYMLDYAPTPSKERLERGPYPFVARLREPTIAEAYRRTQIAYRQSAYQIQFYAYHLWSVDPDRMLADLLLKHLRAARLFTNVTRSVESYTPDYHVTCDIQAIEEYDSPETWYARLAVEYQLIEEKSGQVVWKKLFDLRKAVAQQEPVYVVRELSALAETMHERLVEELEVALDEAKYRNSTQVEVPARP
jgi:ABC-type uncharacterized transport system auxiliary subunit